MNKVFFVFIMLLGLNAFADEKVMLEQLKFRYQPMSFEGADCNYTRSPRSGDFHVKCESKYHKKEFSVHLVLKRYFSSDPKTTGFQVLYWVTNRTADKMPKGKNEYTGSSMMFTIKDDVKAKTLKMGQMVDNGYAHLDMTFVVRK